MDENLFILFVIVSIIAAGAYAAPKLDFSQHQRNTFIKNCGEAKYTPDQCAELFKKLN